MSINILNEAVNAIIELRGNRDFERLLDALEVLAMTKQNAAGGSPVDMRVDATAYARGLYDLWEAMKASYTGQHIAQVKPTASTKRARDDANV